MAFPMHLKKIKKIYQDKTAQCNNRFANSFQEIHSEKYYTVILFQPLIQEGQLSVSGERMFTILVNCSED